MATKDFHERLSMLGFPMFEGDSRQTTNLTLAEVIKSKDIRLWEGFPVMLANSIEKQWFNYKEIEKYLGAMKGVARFDSLIVMSLALYDVINLRVPQIDRFREQFGPEKTQEFDYFIQRLRNNENFVLFGQTMSSERVKTVFSNYYGETETRLNNLFSEKKQYDLQYALSQIFSPRQKELIMKKLRGEKLTKTEREYFSRVVKKKILALANPELHALSQKLLS